MGAPLSHPLPPFFSEHLFWAVFFKWRMDNDSLFAINVVQQPEILVLNPLPGFSYLNPFL